MEGCDEGANEFIYKYFRECIKTTNEKWSFGIGMLSMVFWLFCTSPQIYQNFKTKKVDGVSPSFFSLIFIGNISSIVGLFTVQKYLMTQVFSGFLFLILDGICFLQFIYYHYIFPRFFQQIKNNSSGEMSSSNCNNSEEEEEEVEDFKPPLLSNMLVLSNSINWEEPYKGKELFGTMLGWLSFLIYTGSRIPQVLKNYKSKVAGDISFYYILLAVLGNLAYIISILLKWDGQLIWQQTSYILSSFFPLICDLILIYQKMIYKSA